MWHGCGARCIVISRQEVILRVEPEDHINARVCGCAGKALGEEGKAAKHQGKQAEVSLHSGVSYLVFRTLSKNLSKHMPKRRWSKGGLAFYDRS